MELLLNWLNYNLSPVCDLQGGHLWRLAEALWRWSPIHQAAASRKLGQQLVSRMGTRKECWHWNQQPHSVLFSKAALLSKHFSVFSRVTLFLQDGVFGQYSVRCILDQDVLLQEDVELIELLDPSLLTLGSSPSGSPSRASTLPRPSLIARPSLWYIVRKETHTDVLWMDKIIGSPALTENTASKIIVTSWLF